MNLTHLFEALMLVCFGFSWPLNVSKAYKARTAKGMSLPFIILIITGYLAGITAKIMNAQFNYVLVVYFLNLAIVATNMLVYFRNKTLDKKAAKATSAKTIPVIEIKNDVEKEETMYNYTNSLDEYINTKPSAVEKKNGVILMGGTLDKAIPVSQLAGEYSFNFEIYNKSDTSLNVTNAKNYFEKAISTLAPEGILIHIGESDANLIKTNPSNFDTYYIELIESIRSCNKACRIALVSIDNPNADKSIELINAHIKAIAGAEKATFVNLENAKLWHPESTKAACNFAHSMGLKVRKPLNDVAEILYSYAYHNIEGTSAEHLAS
jgi:hypothetical protein